VNAGNVSLLLCNADRTEGEWTSSRTRVTVAASGKLRVGCRFCPIKFFAVLMAASIMRSEFMSENAHEALLFACDSLIFDALDFNI
jgi:hypothetical protein